MTNVIDSIVANDLCCGCGICAAVTPCSMQMVFNEAGEYVPTPPSKCTECGVCLAVCPFAHTPSPPSRSPLGDPIACHVGHVVDEQRRRSAASGGITSALLAAVLQEGLVDAVIAVVATNDPACLFEPAVLDSPEQVLASAKSKYYPVEFSAVLAQIKAEQGRYAIVALPCVIRGLRLAQQRFKWLRQRLKFTFGLTCGQNTSKSYTSFLSQMAGIAPEKVATVDYRGQPSGNASDFVFEAANAHGHCGRPLPFTRGPVGPVWTGHFFSLGACFYCEDLFAEYADISLMDAWLPEYTKDTRGHSIVCVRNKALDELLGQLAERGEVVLEPISHSRVLASQQGALRFKSERLGPRLAQLERRGISVPTARVRPQAGRLAICDRLFRHHRKLAGLLVRGTGIRVLLGCWALRAIICLGWGLTRKLRRTLAALLRPLRPTRR